MRSLLICAAVLFAAADAAAQPVDEGAAEALAKKSGCLMCHSVTQKRSAPSFKEVAAKYKGKADGDQTLFKHLTTNPKVKVDDREEAHDSLKTKNEAEVRNVVRWILSR